MKINEYVNELICIYDYLTKGQCLWFHVVPTLLIYVEQRLIYAEFSYFSWIFRQKCFIEWS